MKDFTHYKFVCDWGEKRTHTDTHMCVYLMMEGCIRVVCNMTKYCHSKL